MQTGNSSKKAKLVNAFGVKVGQFYSRKKHKVVQKWLDDSFNLRVEIEEIMKKVPVDEAMT